MERERGWLKPNLGLASFVMALVAVTVWHGSRRPALAEAEGAWSRHDARTALTRALDDLDRHPGDGRSAVIAAQGLSLLNYGAEAEPYYRVARRRGPLGIDALQTRALGLVRSNLRQQAVDAYEEILGRDPKNALALRRLATVQWTRGLYPNATALARRLAELPEGAVAGRALQATLHHEEGLTERAVPLFEEVLRLDPGLRDLPMAQAIFWREFGDDLLTLGQAARARELLEPAAAKLDDAPLYDLLGIAYDRLGDPDRADECWRRSIVVDPQRANPWKLLARRALRTPSPEASARALEALGRALAIDPNSYDTVYSLGLVTRRLGRIDEAAGYEARAEQIRAASRRKPAGPPTSPSRPSP